MKNDFVDAVCVKNLERGTRSAGWVQLSACQGVDLAQVGTGWLWRGKNLKAGRRILDPPGKPAYKLLRSSSRSACFRPTPQR